MVTLKISDELKNVIKQVVLDTYFPVGALYASFNNVDPNSFLLGTWVRISGAYLMAGDPNSTMEHKNIGGAVGLSWNKTTGSTSLTVGQLPKVSGDANCNIVGHQAYNCSIGYMSWVYGGVSGSLGGGNSMPYGHVKFEFGNNEGHTHSLPTYPAPTIVLNVWRRTA